MKLLKHPHILPLYAAFVEDEELWMVMPYVDGGAALDIMQRQHRNVSLLPARLPPPRHPPHNSSPGAGLASGH